MIAVLFFCLVGVAQSAITPKVPVVDKLKIMEDLQDAEVIREVEQLIEGLDDVTLAKLEKILSDDLTAESELKMIQDELTEMGMDTEDIQDLLDLAALMTEFLNKVPDVEAAVVGEDDYSLEDNAKLYLLGLPNKLGPLGFLALHSVLESDESNIVDVKIGSFEPMAVAPAKAAKAAKAATDSSVLSLGDELTRRKAAAAASVGAKASGAAATASGAVATGAGKSDDLVADILARRRRSLGNSYQKN